MSKKTFTAEEVELLSKNKYVQNVSEKSITYSNEFKIYFIAESKKEKTSRLIFEEAGFDIGIIGEKHCEVARARWRKAFKDKGVLGLDDTHLCKTANVSRSGYYNYLKCNDKRKQREKADVVVRDTILIAFNHRGYKKGSRFINLSDKITLDIATGTIHKLMATPGLHLDKTAFIHSDQGVH
ncbi:hypothetical protein GCM10008908_07650 [Clostridium subterminale]|uniref:Transposase n=1 Tax=Clostridium subterminale TaxID=1550 RepID=A0ABP3VS07_CLOSU